jgi:hypothetical protein
MAIIEDTQKLTGCEIERAYVDRDTTATIPRTLAESLSRARKRDVFGPI